MINKKPAFQKSRPPLLSNNLISFKVIALLVFNRIILTKDFMLNNGCSSDLFDPTDTQHGALSLFI